MAQIGQMAANEQPQRDYVICALHDSHEGRQFMTIPRTHLCFLRFRCLTCGLHRVEPIRWTKPNKFSFDEACNTCGSQLSLRQLPLKMPQLTPHPKFCFFSRFRVIDNFSIYTPVMDDYMVMWTTINFGWKTISYLHR